MGQAGPVEEGSQDVVLESAEGEHQQLQAKSLKCDE